MTLSAEHVAYLAAHAIEPAIMELAGLYSVLTVEELPADFSWYGQMAVPAIAWPWQSPVGDPDDVVLQLKPDVPIVIDDEERKYLLAKGARSVLNAIVPKGDMILIVEGSKQHLAAASYAPLGWAVYGLMGCSQWMDDNVPISDLEVVEDKEVVVCFDADLGSNRQVWNSGSGFADALRAEGATDVKWIHLPAGKSAGLDDVLARRDPARRAAYLARLIEDATAKLPAKPRGRAGRPKKIVPTSDGRPRIVVTGDQFGVINDMTTVMVGRWSGSRLFNHGGVISEREDHLLKPLDRGSYLDLLQETARIVVETDDGDEYTWPHPNCVSAALTRAGHFAPLHRISRVPFVRDDGTICQAPGYDEATATFLISELDVHVPDTPTPEQVAAAVALILDDWLCNMPFTTDADRANALALVLTPSVRGLVDLVPLAVIDGLQAGVGKNLLADCISIHATGDVTDPLPYSSDNEELRKLITSAFRRGLDYMAFDEAHVLEGAALARSLTALNYSDRVLGVSVMASFPNRVTWLSMGNQVQVKGDVARRVYPIALRPAMANPEQRAVGDFRHANLRKWTRRHRKELLEAALTIIRAWFVAGKPESDRGAAFGSFEAWGAMVGGMVEHAGVPGFLENVRKWRSDSDFETAFWSQHLRWLESIFGEKWFTCSEVRRAILANPETSQAPPGLEDTSPKDYVRALGMRYARVRDRILDGFKLVRSPTVLHDNINKWRVEPHQEPEATDSGGKGGTPLPHAHGKTLSIEAHAHTRIARMSGEPAAVPPFPQSPRLAFDLETASADDLWRFGPGFVRLVGYRDGNDIATAIDPAPVLDAARAGVTLVGHNVYAFDIPALVRYHGLDLFTVSVIDTKLLAALADPPPAKMKTGEAERYYSLDAVCQRLELGAKTVEVGNLAKEFGGYHLIPQDDPRYLERVRGDVELTAALADRLMPLDDYAVREHEIARITCQVSLNGFRVDVDELHRRITADRARRKVMLESLEPLGLPKVKKDGKECTAPLATEAGKLAVAVAFSKLGVKLPATGSGHPALDHDTMQGIIDAGGEAAELAEIVQSINGIRTILEQIDTCRVGDRVHPSISTRQASGRWSVTKPGLTVVGKRGGRHVEREVFLPEPGHVIVSVDLAQIDARAVAAHSQDPHYLAACEPGKDLHAEIAARIWGDPTQRERAKPLTHGWSYGASINRISKEARVSWDVAQQFDQSMREQFPFVVEWQTRVRAIAESGDLLDNGFGRKMRPEPGRSWNQAPALVGQGCARDLMMEGLLRLSRETWPMFRGVIHDEVLLSVPADIVDDVERTVVDALSFEWAPAGASIPVQVVAEPAKRRGTSWGDVYRKEES